MKIVDGGLILRFLSGSDADPDKRAKALFARLEAEGEKVHVPLFVLFEVIYVLEKYYQPPRLRMAEILVDFLSKPHINVNHRPAVELALKTYGETHYDLADCYLAALIKTGEATAIYSEDSDFDGLDVPRIAPD